MSAELSADAAAGSLTDAETWSVEELDAAYQRALAALDAVDSEILATAGEASPGAAGATVAAGTAARNETPPSAETPASAPEENPPLSAAQVIEACLFVGGTALTAGRLAALLKGDYTAQFVEETIDALNRRYRTEGRPYEVRLGEGGYRLVLREEYERLRHKVFGLGPREVRLSQEALEVLAAVAYHQPVSEAGLAELGKPHAGPTLRQLLRRDLLAVQRETSDPKTPLYVTTPRFLSLFGLGSLDELPRPETLLFK
jgi:segregation and condensation protein B